MKERKKGKRGEREGAKERKQKNREFRSHNKTGNS